MNPMNKHFQDLAHVVGRALAKRWMERCAGGPRAGVADAIVKSSAGSPPPLTRRRLRHQQRK
jgi:hypothetical protein